MLPPWCWGEKPSIWNTDTQKPAHPTVRRIPVHPGGAHPEFTMAWDFSQVQVGSREQRQPFVLAGSVFLIQGSRVGSLDFPAAWMRDQVFSRIGSTLLGEDFSRRKGLGSGSRQSRHPKLRSLCRSILNGIQTERPMLISHNRNRD